MNRFHRRVLMLRTRFYVAGFVFWLLVIGLIALGGAITD